METEQLFKEVQNLLNHISVVDKKYDDIVKITGERFNVFEILKLASSETRTHSAFLAALLDPTGQHGLGNIILSLFIKQIGFNCFDSNTGKVSVERSIGNITKGYLDGGRIDIVIEDQYGHAIIIENKINAGDQHKQLFRYFNYAKSNYKEGYWKILYLNLEGNKPHKSSTNNELIENKDYEIISYKDTITLWLEECKKEATNYPILRETITQYNILIRNLTNQSINIKMEEEIIKQLIKSEDSMEAAFIIRGTIEKAQKYLFNKLKTDIKKWAEENKYEVKDGEWGEIKESYLLLSYNELEYKLPFFFCFDNFFRDFCVGIESVEKIENDVEIKAKIIEGFTRIFGKPKVLKGYTYLYYFQGNWAHWTDRKFMWIEIISGKTQDQFIKWIKEITLELETVLVTNTLKDKD